MGTLDGSAIGGRWTVFGSGNTPTAGETAKDCVTNLEVTLAWAYIMNNTQG